MVVTRSGLSRTRLQESSQQKRSVPRRIGTHLESKKESGSDGNKAESQSAEKQSSNSNSRTTGPAEIIVLISDGDASETESHASGISSVLQVEEPIVRVTRKRRVVIVPTPKSTVRKRQKVAPQHESVDEGVVSEAESHASGVSMVIPSTESSSRNQAKSQRDSSQDSQSRTVPDAEWACSGTLSSEIAPRRTARNVKKKLQFPDEKKDTKITPGNKKQIVGMSVYSEDSDATQASQLSTRPLSQRNMPNISESETCNNDFDDSIRRNSGEKLTAQNHQNLHIQEEKQANVVSLTEVRKENCKRLDEEDPKITEEKVINEIDSQLSLSEAQDTSLQQSVSQNHSGTPNKKPTFQLSSPDRKALMKSLEHKFAIVNLERWNDERGGSVKKSDLAQLNDGGDSNDEPTSAGVSEDKSSQCGICLECDTKPCKAELSVSQDTDSPVILFLSSDESQQSDSSENERDTLSDVENSGQKEALAEDLEDAECDGALFVIDKTPGVSADKTFYLEDKAPSEAAIEEEKEEEEKEEENSEEDSSDSDENKDESSDEEDLLNNTKSKLLKLTSSSIDTGLKLDGLYINFNVDKLQPHKKTLTQIEEKRKNELLQKAVITPDFEKKSCVPPYSESKRQLQKQRRKERQKTAGNGWFGMKAPELTDELKNDLRALKMRAGMDPKRFYKKNDRDGFPKYFQVGTIVDNPADFYHSRIPKKQRKKTIVEELLADSEFRR
ncbi:deoxynucleotidyltransferase terminal-interacting protein 2 [Mus pahari]|uniref:deoxynucleotidyltransferase terminal-interacting protein 2 n=1 Tax=Mus pahari TaxID=10093 RepID=UPI001114EC5F|nr:deoxynucleotidyltransferase terminal-interacting protein 2 [Mus pahari]